MKQNIYFLFFFLFFVILEVVLSSCNEKKDLLENFDVRFELLIPIENEIEQLIDSSKVGSEIGEYPQENMDELRAGLVTVKLMKENIKKGLVTSAIEVKSCFAISKVLIQKFKNSCRTILGPGIPMELFVNGRNDANRGRIEFGSSPEFAGSSHFTAELWLKFDETIVDKAVDILSTFNTNFSDRFEGWFINTNRWQSLYWFRCGIGLEQNGKLCEPAGDTFKMPSYNEWHHVAMVYDENGGDPFLAMYVDGNLWAKEETLDNLKFRPNKSDNASMHAFSRPTEPDSYGGAGYIKKVRLWRVSKSEADIKNLMTTEVIGTEAGLICAWDFMVTPQNTERIPDKTGRFFAKLVGDCKTYKTKCLSN